MCRRALPAGDTPRRLGKGHGPKHGYAILEEIERVVGVRLHPGTLYGAIARLARRGVIEPLATDDRRQPYRLTGYGAELARDKLQRLADLASGTVYASGTPMLPLRPREQMQDIVRGSFGDPNPTYRSPTTQDHTRPDDRG